LLLFIFLQRKVVPMAAFLFFFIAISASNYGYPQVSIDRLYEEINLKAGEDWVFETLVVNSSNSPIEIRVRKSDYLFKNGEHSFPKSGTTERSNANWILVEHERMLLPAERKTLLKFPVKIPADISPGSYHSILGVETIPATADGAAGLSINKRHAIQIVINVDPERAVKKLEVVKVEAVENTLFLTIRNTGEQILTFKIKPPISGIQHDRHARIYPNMEEIVELNMESLADGLYEDLRFILDDGKMTIIPVFVTFRKGMAPTAIPLHRIEGESISGTTSKRKQRPAWLPRLNAILTYGSDYKSVSLSGNWRASKMLSFYGSTNYREFSEYFDNKILNYRAGVSINLKGLRLAYSQYWFQNSTSQMASANFHSKGFSSNINYNVDRKIFQGSINQRFFKRWSFRVFGFYDFETERHRFSASLVIPIL